MADFPLPGRFGLNYDPRGAHVTIRWKGRTLLGEVVDVYRNETRGYWHLRVRHFNGEPWPLDPGLCAVEVLERAYSAPAMDDER